MGGGVATRRRRQAESEIFVTRPPTEYEIQRAVCIRLDTPGVLHPDIIYFHCPNGGSRGAMEGKRLKQAGVKAGIYDLTFLGRGGFWVLELKDLDGVLSAPQKAMWPRYVAAGARGVAWANSLAGALAQIRAWGLASC